MIIKKIILNNIRSYKYEEVNFKEGSTLLSGDIGSGKTSILLAIEFALFGLQPGQRGTFLLRNGTDEGGVSMEFEVNEKNVLIERNLKRGKTVSQDYSAITVDGEKEELSVTELKNRVLSLLNYPREFSKKQNLLYKFTVYTPQEEMKQIILQDSDTRLNTLRHVFGIDKYKRILENASVITQKLREEKRIKEALVSTLEEDRLIIVSKEEELESMKSNVVLVEEELNQKSEKRNQVEIEKQEITKKIEEKIRFVQERDKTRLVMLSKEDLVKSNEKVIFQLKEQLKEFENIVFEEKKLRVFEQEILNKKNEKEALNKINSELLGKISSLISKNEENEKLQKNMFSLEICPTCLQDVDSVYRSNVLNKLHNEISQNKSKLQEIEIERSQLMNKISKLDFEISSKEKEITDLKLLKIRLESIDEKRKRKQELENSIIKIQEDISFLREHSENLNKFVIELSKFDRIFELKVEELSQAMKEEKAIEIKSAELKKEIEVFSKQIEELKQRVAQGEEIKSQLNYISELENWLSKKFVPLVSFVEKNVMAKLKQEFSNVFQEWFLMLVSENFNVSLREDFTPIIEQHDYELDYSYLSGGERTAIALAYRLALNQVINSVMSKIKTKDLVILDEPTDGFSEQQLDKMRNVLDELNVKQLIIVSHEQKIEGFVENVVRFKKENGVSKRV